VAFALDIENMKENPSLICGFRDYLYIFENEILAPQVRIKYILFEPELKREDAQVTGCFHHNMYSGRHSCNITASISSAPICPEFGEGIPKPAPAD
jgi:hypothetical protein